MTINKHMVMTHFDLFSIFCSILFSREFHNLGPTSVVVAALLVGSSGLVVRALDCWSRGWWFDSPAAISKLGQFHSSLSPNHCFLVRRVRHTEQTVYNSTILETVYGCSIIV